MTDLTVLLAEYEDDPLRFAAGASDREWSEVHDGAFCGGCGREARDCCGGCTEAICSRCEHRRAQGLVRRGGAA